MASMADSSKINAIVVVLIQDFDFMFRVRGYNQMILKLKSESTSNRIRRLIFD